MALVWRVLVGRVQVEVPAVWMRRFFATSLPHLVASSGGGGGSVNGDGAPRRCYSATQLVVVAWAAAKLRTPPPSAWATALVHAALAGDGRLLAALPPAQLVQGVVGVTRCVLMSRASAGTVRRWAQAAAQVLRARTAGAPEQPQQLRQQLSERQKALLARAVRKLAAAAAGVRPAPRGADDGRVVLARSGRRRVRAARLGKGSGSGGGAAAPGADPVQPPAGPGAPPAGAQQRLGTEAAAPTLIPQQQQLLEPALAAVNGSGGHGGGQAARRRTSGTASGAGGDVPSLGAGQAVKEQAVVGVVAEYETAAAAVLRATGVLSASGTTHRAGALPQQQPQQQEARTQPRQAPQAASAAGAASRCLSLVGQGGAERE